MIAGLVLGAGSSSRLGQPKQLLEFQGRPLLQTAIDNALASNFDQVVVAIGGAAPEVREAIDFGSAIVAENVAFTTGCSSSIVAALDHLDPAVDGLVLLLGDQPRVTVATINAMISAVLETATVAAAPVMVCNYDNGRGHPFGFGRSTFPALAALQGDKAVWKLLESGRYPIDEVRRPGPVPLDVDTWDDYQQLIAEVGQESVQ